MVDQIRLKEVKILARGHTVTMRSAWMASREPGSRVQIWSLRLSKTNLLFLLKQSGAITYPKPFSPLGAQLELKPRSISHLKKLLPKEGKLEKERVLHLQGKYSLRPKKEKNLTKPVRMKIMVSSESWAKIFWLNTFLPTW